MTLKILDTCTSLLAQYQLILGDAANTVLSTEILFAKISHYYEGIIGCMPGNVYWLNAEGIAQGCNKNVLDMFGFSTVDQFRGLDFVGLGEKGQWSVATTASFKADSLAVIHTGLPKLNIEEPPIYHADGRVMYFLTSRVPLFDHQQNIIGVVGISIDITERKLMEQALIKAKEAAETANRAKQEFLNNIRHDIRTPFSGLLGMSKMLEETEVDPDKKEKLQWVAEGAQSLLDYLNELVEFIEVESGEKPVVFEVFDMKVLLQDALALFTAAAKAKNLTLECDDLTEHVALMFIGDKYRVQRVLINLLGNAIKFTHTGHIRFGLQHLKQTAEQARVGLWVSDTGIGIPADKYQFIFEKFSRLSGAQHGLYKGPGLGLRAVKKIMDELEGEIAIDSVLGQGTTFTCTFPFALPLPAVL